MKNRYLILVYLLILNTKAMEQAQPCYECQFKHEATSQKFPVLDETTHWVVIVNMLSHLRAAIYLVPKSHSTSFTQLSSEELEEYRELIIKWKPVLNKETKLEAFNTGWEENSDHHFCVQCAVRSPNDSGAITGLLGDRVITRNAPVLYAKLLKTLNPALSEEEISAKLAPTDTPSLLPTYQFFRLKEQSPQPHHFYDSSSRETYSQGYAATAPKKAFTGCFFCEDMKRDFDDEKSPLVFQGKHSCVLTSIGSYADGHLLYCPKDHVTSFEDLPREQALDFLATNQKCISVLNHKKEELLTGGILLGTQSFIQEGVGSGATVPQHLHGQTLLKGTIEPEGVVATFYGQNKTVRDLSKIRAILRKGFKELQC